MKLFDPETLFLIAVLCFFCSIAGALCGYVLGVMLSDGSRADEMAEKYGPK